jgi:hypothetical protein
VAGAPRRVPAPGARSGGPQPGLLQDVFSVGGRAEHLVGDGEQQVAVGGETSVRLNLVAAWREASVFTEAEQAALALTEEGTRLADACRGVSDDTWAQVRKHYDDDQIAALVCLVAMINAANRLGVIVRQKGGSYEPGMFASMLS